MMKQLFQNHDIWCDPQLRNQPRYGQPKTNLRKSVFSSLLKLKIKIPFWGTIALKINDWLENYSYPYKFDELRKSFPWGNFEEFKFTLRWPKRNQNKFSNYQIEIWIVEITIAVTNPIEYVFSQRFYELSKSPWLNLRNSKDSTS